MLVRKRGGGGGGGGMGSGGTGWFVLPGPSTLDPVLKIFYIESDPIIEIVKVLRFCLARKKYCSVFTDLTQGVSISTGIQPPPHTTDNSCTHLCSNPQNSQSACSIIQTWGYT